ncbi:lipase family protein [Pseudomonas sp. SH10-3B]|uniref:lipase family protein n=1 Tax=Pseudomonas sp. SH10-3B TaxID=2816049 RepID=UPI001CA67EF4|nr:lipase family protein [Pseudomonas sp. SH10-3B]MBY8946254.1 lipase family protein [Pseudomonas sp. SH10-3B]
MQNMESLKAFLELAKVSKAAYASPIAHKYQSYKGKPFDDQRIIHGSIGRGFCRIFWNTESVVICFRGTRESVDWQISNLRAFPVKLQDCPEASNTLVHRGFQRTLNYDDKTTKLRSLDAILRCLEENSLLDKKIAITGHSLGGALAILFAVKLRSSHPDKVRENLESIITFGSPAVGLSAFKKLYGELGEKTVRLINSSDAVPFTPPLFYQHVGSEIWLQNEGISTNAGWLTRLAKALKGPASNFSSDHSIVQYILKLKALISAQTNSLER